MANTIKTRPSVGDIVIIVDGQKRFVAGADATTAFIDQQQCLGVVYDVQGNYVRIVAGVNDVKKQWSCVADYEITAIPSESGDYEVKLNNVVQGNFTYTKSDGTIAEFTTQLNDWLAARPADSKALKWEAYTNDGHSYLQMKTYDEKEGAAIASTTLVKLIGSELAAYTSDYSRNAVKQSARNNGMCIARLDEYVRNSASGNCNPTSVMNGTTQLFVNYPCSKAYYDGANGTGLRANYATYDLYLDACMARLRELNHGCMQYRDGKMMTDLLYTKTVLKNGVSTKAYTAACYAKDYDCGVSGYGVGTFWLPSIYELSILMKDMTYQTAGTPLDKINLSLGKRSGWNKIKYASYIWTCSRNDGDQIWDYYHNGTTRFHCAYEEFNVVPVYAFTIDI